MDYKKIAEDALRERASIFEKRKALLESDATDAEKREQCERMDADMDRLASEAREAVEAGEQESELRALHTRAAKLGLYVPGADQRNADTSFEDSLRSVGTGELREFRFNASAEVMERRFVTGVSGSAGSSPNGEAGPVTPDTFVATLLDSMEEASDVVARVRKISTSTGEQMNWPRRVSKTGNTFQKIAEAGTYQSTTDGSFALAALLAHKFGAIAEISEEALTDPALNVGSIVAQDMGEDLAESLAAAIWGTKSAASTDLSETLLFNVVNTKSLAAKGAPTFDELIDLQHAIISKYRRNAVFYMNDLTARDVRKIKDLDDNYVWQPATVAGQPDLLLGKPVSTDPVLPTTAVNEAPVVFGDLGRAYTLRNVRQIGIVRSDEFGFDRDTVALKIKWRGDGMVSDPEAYAAAVNPAV